MKLSILAFVAVAQAIPVVKREDIDLDENDIQAFVNNTVHEKSLDIKNMLYQPIPFQVKGTNVQKTVKSLAIAAFLAENDDGDGEKKGGLWLDIKSGVKSLFKRSVFEVLNIKNQKTYYLIPLQVGSQRAREDLLIDTGSSDMWIPDNQATGYKPSLLKTFKPTNEAFSIKYGDGTYAIGDWGYDTVHLGSLTLDNVKMGVCDNVTAGQGILGIGMVGNEATAKKYANLPILLKTQGYLDRISYSLYLDTPDASSGSLLLGAIDTAKYEGDLKRLPMVAVDDSGKKVDKPIAFFVNLNSISGGQNAVFSQKQTPALLDSGTTLFFAPTDVYEKISSEYGHHVPGLGYVEKCNAHKGKNLTLDFGATKISVPVSQIMYPLTYARTGKPVKSLFRREPYCTVGVSESSGSHYILGDNILRLMYVHFDLSGGTIGVAQMKNTEASRIVPYNP